MADFGIQGRTILTFHEFVRAVVRDNLIPDAVTSGTSGALVISVGNGLVGIIPAEIAAFCKTVVIGTAFFGQSPSVGTNLFITQRRTKFVRVWHAVSVTEFDIIGTDCVTGIELGRFGQEPVSLAGS